MFLLFAYPARTCYGHNAGICRSRVYHNIVHPLLGHRIGWFRGFAVLCGFGGVVAVMQPIADTFSILLL